MRDIKRHKFESNLYLDFEEKKDKNVKKLLSDLEKCKKDEHQDAFLQLELHFYNENKSKLTSLESQLLNNLMSNVAIQPLNGMGFTKYRNMIKKYLSLKVENLNIKIEFNIPPLNKDPKDKTAFEDSYKGDTKGRNKDINDSIKLVKLIIKTMKPLEDDGSWV